MPLRIRPHPHADAMTPPATALACRPIQTTLAAGMLRCWEPTHLPIQASQASHVTEQRAQSCWPSGRSLARAANSLLRAFSILECAPAVHGQAASRSDPPPVSLCTGPVGWAGDRDETGCEAADSGFNSRVSSHRNMPKYSCNNENAR